MNISEHVILVDENDNQTGTMEKMEAHRKAILHRAISVFLINENGEWILQRRSIDKYHSKDLWTNACCSHPYPNESNVDAANRRLVEEMGIHCKLNEIFSFTYKEPLENEITEHEFDHVFLGITDKIPTINTDEVGEWKLISYSDLKIDIHSNPEKYTVWFKKIYEEVNSHITKLHKE
jgi:isopentenyl-diphosphate Delta-isomerase